MGNETVLQSSNIRIFNSHCPIFVSKSEVTILYSENISRCPNNHWASQVYESNAEPNDFSQQRSRLLEIRANLQLKLSEILLRR
jgi:hypothetical protein